MSAGLSTMSYHVSQLACSSVRIVSDDNWRDVLLEGMV